MMLVLLAVSRLLGGSLKWELPLVQCESGSDANSDIASGCGFHVLIFSSEIGETPLHKAAETSSVAVVKLLLDEGAEINPKTDAKVSRTITRRYMYLLQ